MRGDTGGQVIDAMHEICHCNNYVTRWGFTCAHVSLQIFSVFA